jgi:hypothetical protein
MFNFNHKRWYFLFAGLADLIVAQTLDLKKKP